MTGLFITIEGGDGAGKTTQAAMLRTALEQRGIPVCATREPGGDPVSEATRALLLMPDVVPNAELLLFLAARAQHVQQTILPHLSSGFVVVSDRYSDSTIAYQGHGRGIGRDLVARLNAFATGGLTPKITFLLDLDPDVGLARQADANRMEAEAIEFHRRVRQGFLEEAQNDRSRFVILDATLPPETLHNEIVQRSLNAIEAQQRS